MAAVEFAPFETFGRVVKDGSGGHDGQRAIGPEFGRRPSCFVVPFAGYHVVGTDVRCSYFWGGWVWNGAWRGGIGRLEVRGAEGGEVGAIGGVRAICWRRGDLGFG